MAKKYKERVFDKTWETLAAASVEDVQRLGVSGLLKMFENYHKHQLNENQKRIAAIMLQKYVNQ